MAQRSAKLPTAATHDSYIVAKVQSLHVRVNNGRQSACIVVNAVERVAERMTSIRWRIAIGGPRLQSLVKASVVTAFVQQSVSQVHPCTWIVVRSGRIDSVASARSDGIADTGCTISFKEKCGLRNGHVR